MLPGSAKPKLIGVSRDKKNRIARPGRGDLASRSQPTECSARPRWREIELSQGTATDRGDVTVFPAFDRSAVATAPAVGILRCRRLVADHFDRAPVPQSRGCGTKRPPNSAFKDAGELCGLPPNTVARRKQSRAGAAPPGGFVGPSDSSPPPWQLNQACCLTEWMSISVPVRSIRRAYRQKRNRKPCGSPARRGTPRIAKDHRVDAAEFPTQTGYRGAIGSTRRLAAKQHMLSTNRRAVRRPGTGECKPRAISSRSPAPLRRPASKRYVHRSWDRQSPAPG